MKRVFVHLAGAICLGLGVGLAWAEQTTRDAMRAKLDYSRGALEGLTLAKFDLVTTNALRLRDLSQTNVFRIIGNPEYLFRTTNFFQSVDRLLEAARVQNLERATTAYGEVVRNCIECHKTFRREQFLKTQSDAAAAN